MKRLVALLLSTGCATAGTFQTAHTLGTKGWEVGGDLSALVIVDASSNNPWLPSPRAVVRAGVSERVDLGGSVGIDGLRVQAKVQLTPTDDEGVVVSLMPGVRVLPLPDPSGGTGFLAGLEQAVLIGIPTTPESQLVTVVRAAQDVGLIDGNRAALFWGGGSVGWSFRPAEAPVRVMPEVGGMVPLVVLDGDGAEFANAVILQAGLGIVFGRQH